MLNTSQSIDPSLINVGLNIADFEIKVNSEEGILDLAYFVKIDEWTSNNLKMIINFTNPLAIS